jgi:signal transduction histidine kinase
MPATRLRGLWSSRLWILSAVLGATTVYSAAATIHDGNRRGLALGLVIQATAMHLSTLASSRLDRLALEGFAPAGPLAAAVPGPGTARNTIELLARRQRDGQSCRCRELLPVSHFFHFDATNGRVTVVRVDTAGGAAAPSDGTLAAVVRTEADAPRAISNASSRLIVDPRLGNRGVVALVQRDDRGTALAVYGMVVDRKETLAMLFAQTPQHSAIDSAGLARLDSLSLEVHTDSGERLFGSLGPGRAHAVARLGGSLRGLELTIAVSPSRVAEPLLAVHSQLQLFHIAALLLATVIVLALAVTASRRELLLARARSDFIAGVSHDLRMPLAQMLIASETLALQRERTDGERVSLASSIVRETRRLVSLVDNVLLFSRSGALELKPVLRSVDLGEMFDDVVDAVRLAVEDAGQTVEVAGDPQLAIMADRRLVRQALVNLVDNALKYGHSGQRIRIGGKEHGASVQLWVEDEGPGVPKADRDRIFEPYARLDHDQVSERTGTGLGLAVVRQIADASGGRVWMEDATPRGARVVIELPAAPVDEPVVATPVPSRA